jgi:putative SOS response-associated peptidase YedK
MCGRFSNRFTWKQLHDLYNIHVAEGGESWTGRINIPPTVQIPVIRGAAGVRRLDLMRWGMVPPWAKKIESYATHNAKIETVGEKATFKNAWNKRQYCLIPAEAFYEWRKPEKTSFAIGLANGGPMAFAGLWDMAKIDGGQVLSCTLITRAPNALIAQIHDRMPVIVAEDDYSAWLGETPGHSVDLARILEGVPPERMHIWQVSQKVGKVQCQDDDLMEAV